MANYGGSLYSNNDTSQLIGVRTNIEGYFFDAVLKLDHSSKLTITNHPVESGCSITDHAYSEPETLSMEIGMSDVCTSLVDGQFQQSYSRSVSAFNILKKLQSDREPLTVHTRLKTYENMLIETISVPDDYKTIHGLRAVVGLREIIVVGTQTVSLPDRYSANPHKTGETNTGTVQAAGVENQSVLSSMISALTGKSNTSTNVNRND